MLFLSKVHVNTSKQMITVTFGIGTLYDIDFSVCISAEEDAGDAGENATTDTR